MSAPIICPSYVKHMPCPRAMHRHKTTQQGKLRGACDRCHELKNRCVRTGGPESRCDRCDRLNSDCVYRNTSRIGRPKAQTNGITPANNGNGNATVSENGNTILNDPQADLMSYLVSPDVVQQDMDWGHIDFPQHVNPIDQTLFREENSPSTALEPFSFPELGDVSDKEQTMEKLLQLQGQVFRLLSAMDRQPRVNHIEEGLQVTKNFLEIIQAGMNSHSLPKTPNSITTTGALPLSSENGNSGSTAGNCQGADIPIGAKLPKSHATAGANFIIVEQALLCYSYILHMLDRIVSIVTTNVDLTGSAGLEPAATLSIGFFSLASHSPLNAEVLLYIVLRMVQHLRVHIQQLASECKDLTERSMSPPDSAVDMGSTPRTVHHPSISATSYQMASLVSEREKSLVEKLTSATARP